MRQRRRRTSRSARAQSIEHQSSKPSSGPFTTAGPWRPTCPSVRGQLPSSSPQAHLATSAPFRAGQEPVSGQLCGAAGGGAGRSAPVSCRLSAAGVRFLAILCPLGGWASLAVGLPVTVTGDRAPTGLSRCALTRCGRVGRPLNPGDCGALTRGANIPTRRLPLHSGQSLNPGGTTRHPRFYITRRHRGFTHVHPSGLPLACDLRAGRRSLGFSPSFTPCRYRQRMSGRGRAMGTCPSYTAVVTALLHG